MDAFTNYSFPLTGYCHFLFEWKHTLVFLLFLLNPVWFSSCISVDFFRSSSGTISTTSQENKCKVWQENYLRNSHSEQNLNLVAHTIGGLSDSLTGLVTSFLLAYASGRKFYLSENSILPHFAKFGFNVSVPASESSRVGRTVFLDKKHTNELLNKVLKAKERTIHVKGNRGAVFRIVTSPEFKKVDSLKLLEVGQDYIFGCIIRLLVLPTPKTMKHFRLEIDKLTSKSENLKIGIQIRTRTAMRKPGLGIDYIISDRFYKTFLDCALALSRRSKQVVIFIVGDSIELRLKMINDFEKLGINAFTTEVKRMSEITQDALNSSMYLTSKITQGEEVFGESFLLSLCDVFVYTKQSGFGRVAAARAMRENAYYPISERERLGSISSGRQCSRPGFTMKFIAGDSAGL